MSFLLIFVSITLSVINNYQTCIRRFLVIFRNSVLYRLNVFTLTSFIIRRAQVRPAGIMKSVIIPRFSLEAIL